ncbi:GH25237 [Drosophila grimshawi]|uniref:GH25237 n=1 Tax=Drosophila grimshawi TaxID=7222 RepID=B4K354_DROGR|nr:GH25237 [Drosophila grimshawi]
MDAKQTTPSAKRSTAAAVFKSHHIVRNADIVDVASDASLYCGTETETDTIATHSKSQSQSQSHLQLQLHSQPQPTPRAAPRAASATAVNPPTPKPRQAVKPSKGSSIILTWFQFWPS